MNLDSIEQESAAQVYWAWARSYGCRSSYSSAAPKVVLEYPVDRRASDSLAAWLRWHDPGVAKELSGSARDWYLIFEKARVESIATRHLPGIQKNLLLDPEPPTNGDLDYIVYWVCRHVLEGASGASPGWLREQFEAFHSRQQGGHRALRLFRFRSHHALPDAQQFFRKMQQSVRFVGSPERYLHSVEPLISQLMGLSSGTDGEAPDSHSLLGLHAADNSSTTFQGSPLHAIAEQPDGNYESSLTLDFPRYRVFCGEWDEVRPASHWLEPEDRTAMSSIRTPDRSDVRRLAHRFQRQLEASRLCRWSFDLDEGRIDSRRLARLVGEKPNSRVFRMERQPETPESFVVFLVDQSGSMRGERQRMAAMTIDLAVHTLEVCGVPCEVLGYTTRGMVDNPVARLWGRTGQPANPGRLNALRHIVYKSARQPWHICRSSLGLMLRKGFGCENVDGEALDWVSNRLSNRREQRKVVIVVSDGAPYDEATARVHGRTYLEEHLRKVISRVAKAGVHLHAIGPNAEMSRFYSNAIIVRDPAGLPQQIFSLLERVLTSQTRRSL